MAGYSETPLPQKLGIKEGMQVIAIGVPKNYRKLLGKLPDGVEFSNKPGVGAQFIHFFVTRRSELVDVKVCAVDETWSGLKLMIRRERRSKE